MTYAFGTVFQRRGCIKTGRSDLLYEVFGRHRQNLYVHYRSVSLYKRLLNNVLRGACYISASYWPMVTNFAPRVHLTWVHQHIHPRFDLFSAVTGQGSQHKFSGNYGDTKLNPCIQTFIILHAQTYYWMNPHRTSKTRSVWPTLWVTTSAETKLA